MRNVEPPDQRADKCDADCNQHDSDFPAHLKLHRPFDCKLFFPKFARIRRCWQKLFVDKRRTNCYNTNEFNRKDGQYEALV